MLMVIIEGFHRVYRRILEGIKVMNIPKDQANDIKKGVKNAIKVPTSLLNIIQDDKFIDFYEKFTTQYLVPYANKLPPFFQNLSNLNSILFKSRK
jgi:hypothetical protein